MWNSIGALVAMVGLVACASSAPARGASNAMQGRDSVWVVVDNQNFYDAHIYAEFEGSTERRLGQVSGLTRDTFAIVWRNNQLRMRSRLIGGNRAAVSNRLFVEPGDHVELIIRAH